jgi:outer membrane receptor protein involved in Fe transport
MKRSRRTIAGELLVAGLAATHLLAAAEAGEPGETRLQSPGADTIDEIVVTSQRRDQPMSGHSGNIARLGSDTIDSIRHQHISELMSRVAGVWLSRGSGQEHLTAIRSPVLTGAGSCGSFLFLEDGVPMRPSGFCNVNQLFELNTEQAAAVEVIRGPGNALYGSNALHGIINVLTPTAGDRPQNEIAVEAGANDFLRLRARLSGSPERPYQGSFVYADDGGFRDASGYRQGKLQLQGNWSIADGSTVKAVFSATDLDQQTAGFIFGRDAYKDPLLNRGNLNPEAFREASSQRLYAIWKRSLDFAELDIRPFVRHSDMRFLQHFLPGQPLEENGHVSAGALFAISFAAGNAAIIAGADLEWSDMFLKETQFGPTEGSDFLIATRPQGKHYDFAVSSRSVAPYVQSDFVISERFTISAGLRLEYVHYDYGNRMLSGNTRDDGSACGFGGCLYTRPSSRTDSFRNAAPKAGFSYAVTPTTRIFGNLARGFRAPQTTELYRLQSGQQVAELDSERIDSVELGARRQTVAWTGEIAAFAMRKHNSILRDADGFNISGGKSRHEGIEVALDWQLFELLALRVNSSYARHIYDFNLVAARGETFTSGNDVDTAPRWMGSAELAFESGNGLELGISWTSIGDYYLDAENRFNYPGHDLINLRSRVELSRRFSIAARLNNVFDIDYADRADYAFGDYRYFPGRGRELFIELRYQPDASGN